MRLGFNSRCMVVVSSTLIVGVLIASSALALDGTPNKGGRHHGNGHFSAVGPVTIVPSSANCPSNETCYTVTAANVRVSGGGTGNLTGTLTAMAGTAHSKAVTCYPVTSNNETLTSGTHEVIISFSGLACVNSKSHKNILPNSNWTTNSGSPDTGNGKESWNLTPTPSASSAPLAGTGKISFTGTASGP